jgi:hypothetical protein
LVRFAGWIEGEGLTGDEVDAVGEFVDAGLLSETCQHTLGDRELEIPYRPRS